MTLPRKAIVLAAGLGTRLAPLSNQLPKPLMPLWGVPVIGHALDLLQAWGVNEVLINLHHAPSKIVEYAQSRLPSKMLINFSFEPFILGTGGAIKKAKWFLGRSPCWIVNSDIVAQTDPWPFLKEYNRSNPISVLWLHDSLGPRTVEMAEGNIAGFNAEHPGAPGTYTFCGIQLVSPRIVRYMPRKNEFSIIDVYRNALKLGQLVKGVCISNALWADIGTPQSYLAAHDLSRKRFMETRTAKPLFFREQLRRLANLKRSGVTIEGFVALGRNIRVGSNVKARNSIILDNAVIAAGARLDNAVVCPETRVGGCVTGVALKAAAIGSKPAWAARQLGWPPEKTTAIPLGPRGSARSFTRVCRGRRRAILVEYSLSRKENALYAQNARLLKSVGLRVPEILLDVPEERILAIEDVGDDSLLNRATNKQWLCARDSYRKVLDAAAVLHSHATYVAASALITLAEPFSGDLYRAEHELFAHHYLRMRLGYAKSDARLALAELETVSSRLEPEPAALIHRDLQSTNIIFCEGRPVLIDFQGMRFGPAVYDLASLLCDPYVSLSEPAQHSLLAWHTSRLERPGAEIMAVFWWAAVQRLTQAIGAYARLGATPETRRFDRHIVPALNMLDRAVRHVENLPHITRAIRAGLKHANAERGDTR